MGLVGSVVGLLLVEGCYMTYTHYTKKSHLEEAKSAIKNIEDMVEIVKKIPDDDFCDQLDELIVAASCVTDVLPGEEDRMCTICHSRGSDVIRPVKPTGAWVHITTVRPAGTNMFAEGSVRSAQCAESKC